MNPTATTAMPGEPAAATQIQPIPPRIEALRRLLTGLLDTGPSLDDGLALAEALDLLTDVHPPYPPLPPPTTRPDGPEPRDSALDGDGPTDLAVGVRTALAMVEEAVRTSTSIPELGRLLGVTLTLQQIDTAPGPR